MISSDYLSMLCNERQLGWTKKERKSKKEEKSGRQSRNRTQNDSQTNPLTKNVEYKIYHMLWIRWFIYNLWLPPTIFLDCIVLWKLSVRPPCMCRLKSIRNTFNVMSVSIFCSKGSFFFSSKSILNSVKIKRFFFEPAAANISTVLFPFCFDE